MKSNRAGSRRYNIGWQIALSAVVFSVVVAGLAYAIARGFLVAAPTKNREIGPAETITAARPLSSQIIFNNQVGDKGSLDVIESEIEKAQHTVEIAVYSFDSVELKNALYAADKRGVKVTLILDKSLFGQHDLFFSDLPPSITRIDAGSFDPYDSRGTVYMHDKFMIVDRGYPSEIMTTGSLNFTTLGGEYDQSFLLTTSDPDLISVYGKEFDLLKGGVFGIRKLGDTAYDPWAATVNYSDSYVQVWFSPGFASQSIKYQILDEIASAKKSIDVIMWELTDQEIATALAKKAEAGVKVRILAEVKTADENASMIPYLQSAEKRDSSGNLEIILDTKLAAESPNPLPGDFSPYIHHHMMIVDGKTLILGSGNWTLWGFYENDENALITDNAYLIGQSEQTFEHFYNTLK